MTTMYRVKNGKVISTKVVKETQKLYWIDDTEFSYGMNFYKDHACVTPAEAIREEYNLALESMGIRRDHFIQSVKRFLKAKNLKNSIKSTEE